MPVDYRFILEGMPGSYVILSPDFTVVDATDAYLAIAHTARDQLVGQVLFEYFKDNPSDSTADGVAKLHASLQTVMNTKTTHNRGLQRYDIPDPERTHGDYISKQWRPINSPMLEDGGNVVYIIHHVEDVTHMLETLDIAMDTP